MNDRLLEQDLQRLLQRLQSGPQTIYDLHQALRLSMPRVSNLLHFLEQRGLAHAPRMIPGKKGTPIQLWEARSVQPLHTTEVDA